MTIPQFAAAAIALATGLIVFMDWVPTPLNRNIAGMSRAERIPSTAIHGALGAFFVTANLSKWSWVVLVGGGWYSLVLVQAIMNWWMAYLFGIYRGEINPAAYEEHYANNVRFLPTIRDRPVVPDLQHVLIHVAVLAAAVLSWLSFLDLR
jgi:hypothetical protein